MNHVPSNSEARWERIVGACVDNRLVVAILTGLLVLAGLAFAPFRWDLGDLPRDPIAVDALPDISENQQIVFTRWPGRSPRDVEDQVTYPLTTALLGMPGVKSVRSSSALGFSSIYVLFEDDIEFYWSRTRVLEKLASLPANTLPDGVAPSLGPDATALGQVFWYTLEARDEQGQVVPAAFSLDELRSIQDWTVRYALQGVTGVSEVASIGGHVREYQVDVDPQAMLAHGVTIGQVARAVREANLDVGARTMEINRAEYLVRGLGLVEQPADLEQVVITSREHRPIRVKDVATVGLGPALRRGVLDDGGAEAVGGVVTVRFGENPLAVVEGVKARIQEIADGLPRRTLADGTRAQVTIVPFYDRTQLIEETLGTLSTTLIQQVLVTVLVVLVIMRRLRPALVVSAVVPLGVLASFVLMKAFGIDANVMALGGIAIAIGTIVDMGIVLTENIERHLEEGRAQDPPVPVGLAIRRGAGEVAGAVFTSVATTILGFLPIFALTGTEGRLFGPLAYTKTFALVGAFVLAVVVLPVLAALAVRFVPRRSVMPDQVRGLLTRGINGALVVAGLVFLAHVWMPLGGGRSLAAHVTFVVLAVGGTMLLFGAFHLWYRPLLGWCLDHRALFLAGNLGFVLLGATVWLGAERTLPGPVLSESVAERFPGLPSDFMPAFDEGSFLFMPTTTPHASLGQAREIMQSVDAAIESVPEVRRAVGKLGRVDSALDPAPISMVETVVEYVPEYGVDEQGEPVRNWRDHIRTPDDIWREVTRAAEHPGLTGAPKLMPIKTRIVMLQTGMRSAVGIKVRGADLETIERFGIRLESMLRGVEGVDPGTVLADRIVGKPYLEIDIDREAIARHGLTIAAVQDVIRIAIGGPPLTRTVEGRERYPVRVRYMREERDTVEALQRILVPGSAGEQVPLGQLADIRYARGPQMIRAEDTFLTGYVTWDPPAGVGDVESVEAAREALEGAVASGELHVPEGISYRFAGTYENQVRSQRRLAVLVPVALAIIFVLLYLQFRSTLTTLMVFSGVALAASGGFLLLWAYGQPWFLDMGVGGVELRHLFRVEPTPITVAVWVGFLALFGIATDNGVIIATYLTQRFRTVDGTDRRQIRQAVIEAGARRVQPCLMTTATTLLALLPIVTSGGRGADLMIPMALPTVGGIGLSLVSLLTVPVLFAWVRDAKAVWLRR